jgi:hypothetical protein
VSSLLSFSDFPSNHCSSTIIRVLSVISSDSLQNHDKLWLGARPRFSGAR